MMKGSMIYLLCNLSHTFRVPNNQRDTNKRKNARKAGAKDYVRLSFCFLKFLSSLAEEVKVGRKGDIIKVVSDIWHTIVYFYFTYNSSSYNTYHTILTLQKLQVNIT